MVSQLADDILKRHAELEAEKAPWVADWRDVATFVVPQLAFSLGISPRASTRSKVVDNTAQDAADNLMTGLDGLMFGHEPYTLVPRRGDPAQRSPVTAWAAYAADVLNRALGNPRTGFSPARQQALLSVCTLGTGCIFTYDDVARRHLVFRSIPLGELALCEDDAGQVDLVMRSFEWTAKQAAQRFGREALPTTVQRDLEKQPYTRHRYVHFVGSRDTYGVEGIDGKRWPWVSYYIAVDSRDVIEAGGFDEMPYHVARWEQVPNSPWGWSPAMRVLDDIKRVNEMGKTNLRAGHQAVDPSLYLRHGMFGNRPIDRRPGAVSYYDPSVPSDAEVRRFPGPENLPVELEMEQDRRAFVNQAFYRFVLETPSNPNMTATEWLGRQQEMWRRMGPSIGRVAMELAQPLGERAFRMLRRAGAIMPPPAPATDNDVRIEFQSPVARGRRAAEADGTLRTVQAAGAIEALSPGVIKILDGDEAVRQLGESYGAARGVLRSPEVVAEMRAAEAQQQAMAQMAQMAATMAPAAKDMATAAATARESGVL